ncbi:MAG: HEAT repeat domain-containing protein, partial [Gemmatimonadales bacterium]
MRTDFLRFATFVSIAGVACLSAAPVMAQITPLPPAAPTAPAPPPAPLAPLAPVAPAAPLAPAARMRLAAPLAPFAVLDGADWLLLDEARDDAISATRDAVDRLRGAAGSFDDMRPLTSLDLDLSPMMASANSMVSNFNIDAVAPRFAVGLPESPRAPWASADPADSLYRLARESLNSGDYRRAAQLFAQITRQYPTSQYRADAAYWRAFSLYRIGDVADLHEALQVLDSAKLAAPSTNVRGSVTRVTSTNAAPVATTDTYRKDALIGFAATDRANLALLKRGRGADNESAILAMRIRSALAARGDAAAAAQIASAASAGAMSCDEEDAQLRVEALNALVQMDPKNAEPAITRVLARRDSCSVPLRRGAIALAARNNDKSTTNLLISTARTDPSLEVQAEAIRGLSRAPDPGATTALADIATTSKTPALQRIAVRALAQSGDPRAREFLRKQIARTDLPDAMLIDVIRGLGGSQATGQDITLLRNTFASTSSDRARSAIMDIIAQRGTATDTQWLLRIARDTSQAVQTRRRAIQLAA